MPWVPKKVLKVTTLADAARIVQNITYILNVHRIFHHFNPYLILFCLRFNSCEFRITG